MNKKCAKSISVHPMIFCTDNRPSDKDLFKQELASFASDWEHIDDMLHEEIMEGPDGLIDSLKVRDYTKIEEL